MADYIQINQIPTKAGELMISRKVFEQIALEATNRVINDSALKVNLSNKSAPSCKVVFKKNGNVVIKVNITLKKGAKLSEVSTSIQKEIAGDLGTYVESVPFEIEVLIDEIK